MKTPTPRALALGLAACFIAGCATPYQRSGFGSGYSETRLDEHVVRVNFRGNGYTRAERAADLCMLRCAELTLEHGCRFFTIVEGGDTVSHSTYTTPTTSYTTGSVSVYGNTAYGSATTNTYGGQTYLISRPRTTLLIACSRIRPEGQAAVLDAQFVSASIRSKYNLAAVGQKALGEEAVQQADAADAALPRR